jgi:hypothetical protein
MPKLSESYDVSQRLRSIDPEDSDDISMATNGEIKAVAVADKDDNILFFDATNNVTPLRTKSLVLAVGDFKISLD